jgi:hypothetical protein
MDRDTAIDKIKKCLALAKSSNPHEAAAAMRQAQKLMAAFDVAELDISLADVKEAFEPARSSAIPIWAALLASMIAEAFGCEHFVRKEAVLAIVSGFPSRKRVAKHVFVGVGPAAEVATYAFKVLYRQCQHDRQTHVSEQRKTLKQATKSARGDAFALAWVRAVRMLIERLANSQEKADLLLAYMQREYPKMGTLKTTERHVNRHVRNDSYSAGHSAGKKARLDHGVTTNGPQELLS